MTFSPAPGRVVLFLCALLISVFAGCSPLDDKPLDEEKETYFLQGRRELGSMNYPGAIEAFEKALQANPKSAAAHFELGMLYEERRGDFAEAIHHYQKHLELRPHSNLKDFITGRITRCKMELVKEVSINEVNKDIQQQILGLTRTNTALRTEVDNLRSLNNELRLQIAQQAGALSNRILAASSANAAPNARAAEANPRLPASPRVEAPAARRGAPLPASVSPSVSRPSSHIVRAGETMASIGRRYGLSVAQMQSANPRVNPKKIRPGQALIIPPARR